MNHIRNYVQITDDIGTSGQPTEEQFQDIAGAGYAVVINLALHKSDDAIPHEGSLVSSLGMSYVHIPVPFERPTADHLRTFCGVMEAFRGKNVWVHCVMNYRVSAFLYHYLRGVRKLSERESRSPIFERWSPDEIWQDFLALPTHDLQV